MAGRNFLNVGEKDGILENVHCRLTIKKDPGVRDGVAIILVENHLHRVSVLLSS